ncbi:MAG: hypothetical protein AUG08_12450 [Acidobacteria bacterium 13_1_20CM_2_55_15]|nr:MAG: hypothetical protein AUI45_08575 [Acidobacteria bacterium 13_1_40CM_2_56_11]OLE87242.1 MAG: hypothetical protein AUG08_12450 [Acidobacteria bacterium 13_1_20CM_2_55_15]
MQNRLLTLMLTVVAAVSFSPLLWAQTPARPEAAKNTPDLSGMWIQEPGKLTRRFSADDAPLQPWALEIYKANRGGATDPNRNGSNGLDPTMYCLQSGVPRVYTSPFPIEIVQTPGRIYMVFHTQSNPSPRYIYTDGQGHPEGFPTTFMGHSIGRWEGDTLVVDTTSIDEDTWLDGIGTPHSDALHVVERLRRVTPDTLEIEFRFEDPKAYTKPWTGKKVYKLNKDWEYIPGITCDDRFKTDFAQKSLRDKKDWIEFKK